ncbi:MAG: FkbM family methyltransferase, partial [Chitinophagales bacterium]
TLENVAIADETGVKHLHKIAFSQSRWATGLASFNRATLEAEIKRGYVDEQAKREGIIPPTNLEDYFTTEPVDCTTISDLLVKHQFPQLDLLQIDTEGYDFEIIKTVDFTQFKPKIISFEHQHLSPKDTIACQTLLDKQGYTILKKGRDSIAYSTVGR